MRTKLIITLVITIFSTAWGNAQTTYMPVFGDTTLYYTAYGINDGEIFNYLEFKKTNDSTVVPIGMQIPSTDYTHLVVNNSNSKIWGITRENPARRLLLMDLDLTVNDQYVDGGGYIHTVRSVYWLNGRKHIRFEKQCVRLAIVDSTYLEFVEGVGNTIGFRNLGVNPEPHLCFDSQWVRAQYKNGALAYGLPQWIGYWDFIGSITNVKNTDEINTIHLSPSPVSTDLKVQLPKYLNLINSELSIYDIHGKQHYRLSPTEHNLTLDLSPLSAGMYLLVINGKDYNSTVKFIKS